MPSQLIFGNIMPVCATCVVMLSYHSAMNLFSWSLPGHSFFFWMGHSAQCTPSAFLVSYIEKNFLHKQHYLRLCKKVIDLAYRQFKGIQFLLILLKTRHHTLVSFSYFKLFSGKDLEPESLIFCVFFKVMQHFCLFSSFSEVFFCLFLSVVCFTTGGAPSRTVCSPLWQCSGLSLNETHQCLLSESEGYQVRDPNIITTS